MSHPAIPPDITDLIATYGGRWEIAIRPGGLDVITATRRSGRQVRSIIARTAGELAAKLAAAEAEDQS
jgi:hypothetical protein